ncbi:gamma-glutamyl-gamma-aminobutyrate hydrolase family protein [Brevibacillus daliensis]|uniref:gamma-glutamyl-gamma-aminobutyrate hydrolase family protein n=1 Tax=Brevibacillus daliensis TaxID=2892995 RepID=UPI001E322F41|nr:gamma-glutamyl-gamma-aminobutyrate hydrolase family protein [Brevibacillus daliensis]
MKPVIGITTFLSEKSNYSSVNANYIDSIYAAGGIPLTIPIVRGETEYEPYVTMVDGLLFTGGNDVAPYFYGEDPLKEVNSISSVRDEYEFALFRKAYEQKKAIMGICRGIQLINVALGGSLFQDINKQIPDTIGHYPKETATDELYHAIKIVENSRVHEIFGADRIYTNSFHHQSCKLLGTNLVATAFSEDGVIEAFESTEDRYLMGVQWHPECMTKRHPMFLKLFSSFVEAASSYKRNIAISYDKQIG